MSAETKESTNEEETAPLSAKFIIMIDRMDDEVAEWNKEDDQMGKGGSMNRDDWLAVTPIDICPFVRSFVTTKKYHLVGATDMRKMSKYTHMPNYYHIIILQDYCSLHDDSCRIVTSASTDTMVPIPRIHSLEYFVNGFESFHINK